MVIIPQISPRPANSRLHLHSIFCWPVPSSSVLAVLALSVTPVAARQVGAGPVILGQTIFSDDTSGDYLCTAQMMKERPFHDALPFGPYDVRCG